MKLAIIPKPSYYQEEKGSADMNVPIEEKLDGNMDSEAYILRIEKDRIVIQGGSEKALFYGRSTLEQVQMQCREQLPCLSIQDRPAFGFRSFHIDCVRHFVPIEELKKMIRIAAVFKMNYFHWHISNDQGWRIESKLFPQLHQIGAFRKGDHFGDYNSDKVQGGFYTREQVKDVVYFCETYGIEVIPEVDMPGHVTAILAAYPELSCTGNSVEVGTKGGIYRDILCAGKEETYIFLERLIGELLELFPGKYFHIGGDEAPKIRWKDCPACRRRMQREGLSDGQQLQGYLQNRIIAFLEKHNRKAIVWNEAAYGGNLNPKALVQLWTEDKEGKVAEHVKKGGQVILSNMMNCYCDYPYGFISLKSLYELNISPEELKDVMKEAFVHGENVIVGSECLIWTEFVRNMEKLERLCWPRYAASAEVGWCADTRAGYEDFANRLRVLYPVFEHYGIQSTPEAGWIPSEEEAEKQFSEFRKNFRPEDIKEIREAQNEV